MIKLVGMIKKKKVDDTEQRSMMVTYVPLNLIPMIKV